MIFIFILNVMLLYYKIDALMGSSEVYGCLSTCVSSHECATASCNSNEDCQASGNGICCSNVSGERRCLYDISPKPPLGTHFCPTSYGVDCKNNSCTRIISTYCCPTQNGKRQCYLPLQIPSPLRRCPSRFAGEMGKCSTKECNSDEDCIHVDTKGRCCSTTCGGYGCVFDVPVVKSGQKCPSGWNGEEARTCSLIKCTRDLHCAKKDNGVCCRTFCGGKNCYYR